MRNLMCLIDWQRSTDGKKKNIQKGSSPVWDNSNNLDFSQVVGRAGIWMDLVRNRV